MSTFIPLLTLFFTIAAFWWIFLRPGRLTTAAPDTYATPPGPTLRLRFPFVLLNTGAVPVVVADLRLIVDNAHEFHWSSVRKKISPSMDDFLDAAAPFAVRGRDAVQIFVEFGQVPPEWRPDPGAVYPIRLEAKDQSSRWKMVAEFDWWAPVRADLMTATVAHRNASSGGPLL
jgi:hypothetical protein